jgi:23S rRNA (cytidine2498-2'-O)-methyltransferase
MDQGAACMNISLFIGTSNHGFAQYAQEEIKRLFPAARFTLLVPTEVFIFELPVSFEEALV